MALSNYNQDMAFYANHDFVHRMQNTGKKATPNPINKEEHSGLFKLTFTLDADMIGKDSWIVDKYEYGDNDLKIKIAEPQQFIFENITKEEDEDGNLVGYKLMLGSASRREDIIITNNGLLVTMPANSKLLTYNKDKKVLTLKADLNLLNKNESKKKKFSIEEPFVSDDGKEYSFECSFTPEYNQERNTLKLELGFEKKIENIVCEDYNSNQKTNTFIFTNNENTGCRIIAESLDVNRPQNGPFKIEFLLSEAKKKEIMQQLLFVIKNGLMAQSSNELNTIKPLFILAGDVKVPMPVFHADIDVKRENGELKVIGVKDAINNDWLNGNIYLQCNERLSIPSINDQRIKTDWEKFLKDVKLGKDESPTN